MIFFSDNLIPLREASPRRDRKHPALTPGRVLISGGAFFVLAVAAHWSVRLAWADHLSRGFGVDRRERAVRLAPFSATFLERVAEKQDETGGDALPALMRAANVAPADPEIHLRLGRGAEIAGDYDLAERSLLRAAELSRLYQPRYTLAQFYFRRGNERGFFRWMEAALEKAFGDVRPLLVLAWELRPDAGYLTELGLRQAKPVESQFLSFLTAIDTPGLAAVLARHLAATGGEQELGGLLEYCDRMLTRGDTARAAEIWNTLCRRGLLPFRDLEASAVTNGDFRNPPSCKGFDWRTGHAKGVQSRFTNGEWRIDLSGDQPENSVIGWQYVPLKRGKRYRVRSEIIGDNTAGLDWTLSYDASPRLALIYRRLPGAVRLEGTVAVRNLLLEVDR